MLTFEIDSIFSGVATYFLKLLLRTLSYSFDKGLESVFVWMIGALGTEVRTSTVFDPTARFFILEYGYVLQVAKALALPALLAGLIFAVVSGSLTEMLKVVFLKVPLVAIIGSGGVALVALFNGLVEYICTPLESSATTFSRLQLYATGVGSTKSIPIFIVALLFLLGVFAELALWLELILRNGALYLVTATLPLASIGVLFPWGRTWLRRTVEVVVALEMVKFVALLGIWLSLGAVEQSTMGGRSQEVVSTFLSGVAMLIVSVLSPYLVVRLIPLADLHLAASIEGGVSGSLRRLSGSIGNVISDGGREATYDPWPDVPFSNEAVDLPPFEGSPPVYEMVSSVKYSPFARAMYGLDPDVEPTDEQVENLMKEYGVDTSQREVDTANGDSGEQEGGI